MANLDVKAHTFIWALQLRFVTTLNEPSCVRIFGSLLKLPTNMIFWYILILLNVYKCKESES